MIRAFALIKLIKFFRIDWCYLNLSKLTLFFNMLIKDLLLKRPDSKNGFLLLQKWRDKSLLDNPSKCMDTALKHHFQVDWQHDKQIYDLENMRLSVAKKKKNLLHNKKERLHHNEYSHCNKLNHSNSNNIVTSQNNRFRKLLAKKVLCSLQY